MTECRNVFVMHSLLWMMTKFSLFDILHVFSQDFRSTMKKNLFFAQKAIIFKKNRRNVYVLLVKIKDAPKNSKEIIGKYGFPGERMEFGEDPDKAIIRECKEETGVTIKPKNPVSLASWFVEKPTEYNQIVVIFRICDYIEGELRGYVSDEAKLEGCEWVNTKTFDFDHRLIEDNLPAFKSALKIYAL